MSYCTFLPERDYRNEGWQCVGGSRLWDCWNNDDDNKYTKCPSNKNRACVSFPIDTTQVPDGAVITSVTIKLRCSRNSAGAGASVTVNVVCTDDNSRFTTRTITPTTTPTTYEVATYQKDPSGRDWDIHRLNSLLCQVSSSCRVFDGIRCHKFYAEVNYHVRPTVTVENPTGTVLTSSPTISWTYSQADGDPQAKAEYKIFTAAQVAQQAFNADTAAPAVYNWVQSDITSLVLPTSINPNSYYAYVRVYSSVGAKSVWVGRAFTVNGPAPGIPADPRQVAAAPGSGTVAVIGDDSLSAVALSLRDTSNLLAIQQADIETSTDPLEWTGTNCTAVRDTSEAYSDGTASLKVTASSAANMSIFSQMVEVAPSQDVTARVQVKTAVTARTVNLKVTFFDNTFTSLGVATITDADTDSTSSWTELVATGTTPSAASWVQLEVQFVSPANAEVHRVDHASVSYGNGSDWSHGGHVSRNILPATTAVADDNVTSAPFTANTGAAYSRVTSPVTAGPRVDTKTHKLVYNGISPTMAFRATGTSFTSPTTGADYTLNKPAGVTTGDLMIAFVTAGGNFGFGSTINPPAGWTLVNTGLAYESNGDVALFVLKRTAGGSEPSTWTDGSLGFNAFRRQATVVAYSGAADASLQFGAENVTSRTADTPLTITSATLTNNDANAWRIAAFVVNDNASGGTLTANRQAPSAVPSIQFVNAGTPWGRTSSATTYTINKPSGVASGDLMIAQVTAFGVCTVNAPSGWTLVRQTYQDDTTGACTQAIFKRTAGGSEPNSWGGTLSTSRRTVHTQTVAYRNCLDASVQFLAENQSVDPSGNSITTASINNTNSSAWRVCAFAASSAEWAWWGSTNETIQRVVNRSTYESISEINALTVSWADSNGSVSTGSQQRDSTLDHSFYAAVSWIGLIKPLTAAPSPLADETERRDNTVGSADPWITSGIYDSNGVVPTGTTSITATFTPGSGSDISTAASWIGLIKTANPVVSGQVTATMASTVDVSLVNPKILEWADNKVTMTGHFVGSVSGTPYLTLYFYRANALISTQTQQGLSFGTSTWVKSTATFDLPAGTTRIKGEVTVNDLDVADIVYFNALSIAFGSSTVWRQGTGRATHPIWASPRIQYAEDEGAGYGDWKDLVSLIPPQYDDITGQVDYTDHTIVPLVARKYRAQTVSYGLAGDQFVSAYGAESDEVTIQVPNDLTGGWWLKDLSNPDLNMLMRVKAEDTNIGTADTSQVYQALGADYASVITEGYKGDTFEIGVFCTRDEWLQLRTLVKSKRTLFLQSDVDAAWWVRPVGDLGQGVLVTGKRKSNPLRLVRLTFVQVDHP